MTRRLNLSDLSSETLSALRDIARWSYPVIGWVILKAVLITLIWSILIVLLLTHASATFPAAVATRSS